MKHERPGAIPAFLLFLEFGALSPHRHCERSEAIQTVAAEGFWFASLRSP